MKLKTVFILITGVFLLFLFTALGAVLFKEGLTLLALGSVLLGVVSFFVWFKKDALSYRFLYPGMICFFLFTVFPIFFSVFISFTNLGTGHFFSPTRVKELLLNETMLTGDGDSVSYALKRKGNEVYLLTEKYQAKVFPPDKNDKNPKQKHVVILKDKDSTEVGFFKEDASSLTPKEIIPYIKLLKNNVFKAPSGKNFIYHRTDKLIEGQYLYEERGETLFNGMNHKNYAPDLQNGFYQEIDENGEFVGDTLKPGFYTTVGLKNYLDLFRKKDFQQTFLKVSTWTLVWSLVSVFLTFSLGMSLALLLNDKTLRFKVFYRNLLILPYSIPFFISILVFKGMLNKDFGVVNQMLGLFSIAPIPWLENGMWAKISCLLVNLWLGFPYMFLLTTGILQSIPESVYEAAKIDGANRWHSFKSITLPMILNSITPLLIGSFAFNLGNFVGIYLLTGGGPAMPEATTPAGETDILISYTYRLAFEGAMGQQFGLASSIALFIFLVIGVLTFFNFKIFNKEDTL